MPVVTREIVLCRSELWLANAGDHAESEVGRNRAAQQPASLVGQRIGAVLYHR